MSFNFALLFFLGFTAGSTSHSWSEVFELSTFNSLTPQDLKLLFNNWKTHFNKEYKSLEEELKRFNIFIHGLNEISNMNSNSKGFNSAKFRANQFSDMTNEEYKKYITGGKYFSLHRETNNENSHISLHENPSSVDWSEQGVVTPVKDQGECGSSPYFAATGAQECIYAIATGHLNDLSEQQIIDCTNNAKYDNYGCNGGEMYSTFEYAINIGGLCNETEYPYEGYDDTCKANNCVKLYDSIISYVNVTSDNENDLETAVALGCVSSAVDATSSQWQYYSSGIITSDCGPNPNHGILIVGYGTSNGTEYWKLKNSFGTQWGMNGYVLICKDCNQNGDKGQCGINVMPSYPIALQSNN